MATPQFSDLVTPSSSANGLIPESKNERILTLLAMMASGQNPDGTANTAGGGAKSPLVLTANNATETPLVISGTTGQSVDVLQIWNGSGQFVWEVTGGGNTYCYFPLLLVGGSYVSIQPSSGQAAFVYMNATSAPAGIQLAAGGTPSWQVYQSAGDPTLYVRDMVNSRMQISLAPGASPTAANAEIGSNVQVDGSLKIGTRPAFVSGDHYLVCDSNGNVHVSATGPAS